MKKNLLLVLFSLLSCKNPDQLAAMNNIQMPEYEELIHTVSSKEVLKVLIVGNSITTHAIADDIGWMHKSGMAATQENKDYVHLLFDKLSTQYPHKTIFLRFSNWSQFERSPDDFSGFKTATEFNPDVLVFQLSDNTSEKTANEFGKYSIRFLKDFKCQRLVISPFFMNDFNFNLSKTIAVKSNSIFVDISSISQNKINRASNDAGQTKRAQWKSDGIGQHPGDKGMFNISEIIFKAIIQ